MLCAHCHQNAPTPGGTLCRNCVGATAQPVHPVHPAQAGAYGATPMHLPHGPAWLRSPVGLGKAAAVAVGVAAAADLFAVWAGCLTYDVADRLVGDGFGAVPTAEIDRTDTLYTASGIVQVTALVVAAVLFLVWFQRARVNAEVFNPFGHRMKRGWTCWSWFVPIVNLWFPRRIMEDVWDASSPAGRASHGLVNTWWTLWVVSLVADRTAATSYRLAETADEIRDAAGQVVFADAVHLIAGVLAVLVILRLTRMQDEKARGGALAVAV
ncbi:DUF4328 domain-containing protein [Streptomyces sp. NBC_00414]|uniref:DUF4328 domain-containing protein n=1 Tax=Streptomyces sp. NBC_00414 TaxID=2975739 RepID=UPI002E1F3124